MTFDLPYHANVGAGLSRCVQLQTLFLQLSVHPQSLGRSSHCNQLCCWETRRHVQLKNSQCVRVSSRFKVFSLQPFNFLLLKFYRKEQLSDTRFDDFIVLFPPSSLVPRPSSRLKGGLGTRLLLLSCCWQHTYVCKSMHIGNNQNWMAGRSGNKSRLCDTTGYHIVRTSLVPRLSSLAVQITLFVLQVTIIPPHYL